MAIYRKIDCRISNDKKFRELSVEGKLAWYTILSRRDLAPIGAFKASFESLAIEQRGNEYLNEGLQKGLPKAFSEVFIQALNELLSKGLIKYDSESFLIYVPNFLKYNFPENPNVVKSWNSALDSLPECDLTNHVLAKSAEIILNSQRDSFIKALPKEFNEAYRKGFAKDLPKGFAKAFGKGMPKQEQEQEQEQEQICSSKDELVVRHENVPNDSRSESINEDNFNLTSVDEGEEEEKLTPAQKAKRIGSRCPQTKLIELYHNVLPTLPMVRTWTTAERKSNLSARWREMSELNKFQSEAEGLDFFKRFFEFVGRSPFLMGQVKSANGRSPFVASLPWIINATNFANIIEKKYHDQLH